MTAYQKAILYGPGDLRLEEDTLDTGHLAPDEVWVQTTVSALKIGTDRGNYEGAERVPGAPDYPRGVGDSNFGIVRGVGSAVKHLAVGDRVISGTWHQSMYIMQAGEDPAKVPDGADPEDAVYGNLYALSALCYHKALFRPGETVAVVGLGTLGLGAVALGPLFGARTVALGNSDIRLQAARTMGAHEALMSDDPDLHAKLDRFSDGRGIDLVILTANPWPAYKTSLEIVRRDGRVAIVSLLGRGEEDLDFNPLAMQLFYDKAVTLIAVSGGDPSLYPRPAGLSGMAAGTRHHRPHVLQLMADGVLRPSKLITHRLHYTEMQQAYDMAFKRDKTMMNVVFDWSDA